jgi:hypothetical protein
MCTTWVYYKTYIVSVLRVEATHFSETSISNKPTWRHIPEDGILHSHRHESLKLYNLVLPFCLVTISNLSLKNCLCFFFHREGYEMRCFYGEGVPMGLLIHSVLVSFTEYLTSKQFWFVMTWALNSVLGAKNKKMSKSKER